jgi:hypothetical protein
MLWNTLDLYSRQFKRYLQIPTDTEIMKRKKEMCAFDIKLILNTNIEVIFKNFPTKKTPSPNISE